MEALEDTLRLRWEAAGQAQVFRFFPELDAAARERLLGQLAAIEIEAVLAAYREARNREPTALSDVEPATVVRAPADPRLHDAGEALLAEGRVAVVTVAGGQGTRLGFAGPKGAFPIGPVTDRSLFALFAQRIAGLGRRYDAPVPWVVMTSPATDAATRAFFERHGFLGLAREQVRFVVQGTLPGIDLGGRVLLDRPDRVAEAPDGHGGVFAALLRAGALDALEAQGIREIFYHHVDNPLVRTADSAYLGLHAERGAEMSCKVVAKREPAEQMGCLCLRAGQPTILEYSELPAELAGARGADGSLRFWAGSVGIHVLGLGFARRVAEGPPLPLHLAAKPIPAVDPQGRTLRPAGPNGHKLERFAFDALARARSVAVMETRRGDEYSPVKNARGEASPATARRDLVAGYRRWIVEAGLEAPEGGAVIEIDSSRFDGPGDLRREGLRRVSEAAPWIRIAHGAER